MAGAVRAHPVLRRERALCDELAGCRPVARIGVAAHLAARPTSSVRLSGRAYPKLLRIARALCAVAGGCWEPAGKLFDVARLSRGLGYWMPKNRYFSTVSTHRPDLSPRPCHRQPSLAPWRRPGARVSPTRFPSLWVRVHRGSSPSATCGGTAESGQVYPGGSCCSETGNEATDLADQGRERT